MITIELPHRSTFCPGETLAGFIRWEFPKVMQRIDVRLIWFTEVVGQITPHTIEKISVTEPGLHGLREFQWSLPAQPWSYHGVTFMLQWAIEAVVAPGNEVTRRTFICSPHGRMLQAPDSTVASLIFSDTSRDEN